MISVYGDRQICLVRELTKVFEEYQRGSISELITYLHENTLKGECLIIVEGFTKQEVDDKELLSEIDIKDLVSDLIDQGLKPNQAIKQVAKNYKLNRQDVYTIFHDIN